MEYKEVIKEYKKIINWMDSIKDQSEDYTDIIYERLINFLKTINNEYNHNNYNMELKYELSIFIDPYDYTDYLEEISNYNTNQYLKDTIEYFDICDLYDWYDEILNITIHINQYKMDMYKHLKFYPDG